MSRGHAACTAMENDILPGYSSVQSPCCCTPVCKAVLGRERGQDQERGGDQPVASLMESFQDPGSPPGYGIPSIKRNNRNKSL